MTSPFDSKNRIATALDRLALRLLLLVLCILYFYILWHSGISSLIAGIALFLLVLLFILLLERRTLTMRDHALRVRIGGAIALEELLILPTEQASQAVCSLLCESLGAKPLGSSMLLYDGKTYLVRCAQCLPGSTAGEGDVLSAHRAKVSAKAEMCILAGTGGFSPAALRAGEWLDPPVRLISGRQLALLFGQRHPATDEEIARRARRQRSPFTRQRILSLALSPAKQKRYLLCAFLLTSFYLMFGSFSALIFGIASFVLAILCARRNQKAFSL